MAQRTPATNQAALARAAQAHALRNSNHFSPLATEPHTMTQPTATEQQLEQAQQQQQSHQMMAELITSIRDMHHKQDATVRETQQQTRETQATQQQLSALQLQTQQQHESTHSQLHGLRQHTDRSTAALRQEMNSGQHTLQQQQQATQQHTEQQLQAMQQRMQQMERGMAWESTATQDLTQQQQHLCPASNCLLAHPVQQQQQLKAELPAQLQVPPAAVRAAPVKALRDKGCLQVDAGSFTHREQLLLQHGRQVVAGFTLQRMLSPLGAQRKQVHRQLLPHINSTLHSILGAGKGVAHSSKDGMHLFIKRDVRQPQVAVYPVHLHVPFENGTFNMRAPIQHVGMVHTHVAALLCTLPLPQRPARPPTAQQQQQQQQQEQQPSSSATATQQQPTNDATAMQQRQQRVGGNGRGDNRDQGGHGRGDNHDQGRGSRQGDRDERAGGDGGGASANPRSRSRSPTQQHTTATHNNTTNTTTAEAPEHHMKEAAEQRTTRPGEHLASPAKHARGGDGGGTSVNRA